MSDDVTTVDVAVLFADLAGFTALTEAHGDEEAARAALRLLDLTRSAYEGEARLVKPMGDGVMVVFDRVDAGVAAALALAHAAHTEDRFPGLRVGVDAGPAVVRGGDVFGATVNRASRVADHASPGQVLLTGRARARLRDATGLELIEQGTTTLRHVRQPVDLVEARGCEHPEDVRIDPVCQMRVIEDGPGVIERVHHDRTIRFCSVACARLFAARPDAYV